MDVVQYVIPGLEHFFQKPNSDSNNERSESNTNTNNQEPPSKIRMSYFLRVFCQSPQLLPSSEITDFIRDGWYFDKPPNFQIQPNAEAEDEAHWKFITIHYQTNKRPVRIELNLNDELLQPEIEETIEVIRKSGQLNQQQNLVEKLAASKQIIAIEIDYSGLTDAAWEMVDCLEAYLAMKLSGIVYAPEDGFYDENLQPIYKLETPISIW